MMGDAAKPCFARRAKERGFLNEEDFQKGALHHDCQWMDDYGHGHSSKLDIGLERRKGAPGHSGTSPRKGSAGVHGALSSPNSFKHLGHNQGTRINEASKDQMKKWASDNHRNHLDSWKEYKSTARIPVVRRTRKDSSHESDNIGSRHVRRQLQKDTTSEEVSDWKVNSGKVLF